MPLFMASGYFPSQPEHQKQVLTALGPFGSTIVYKGMLVHRDQLRL